MFEIPFAWWKLHPAKFEHSFNDAGSKKFAVKKNFL
jgi:hypothetical protein